MALCSLSGMSSAAAVAQNFSIRIGRSAGSPAAYSVIVGQAQAGGA
jgi:hypothetical protein